MHKVENLYLIRNLINLSCLFHFFLHFDIITNCSNEGNISSGFFFGKSGKNLENCSSVHLNLCVIVSEKKSNNIFSSVKQIIFDWTIKKMYTNNSSDFACIFTSLFAIDSLAVMTLKTSGYIFCDHNNLQFITINNFNIPQL